MSKEKVILVDENDTQVGLMPKLEAHQKSLLQVFGLILVVVTLEKVKKQLMQLIED